MDNNNATIQQNQEIQNEDLARASNAIGLISQAFSEKVVGQERLRAILIISLITGGNILLESVPGLAKTTAVKALASSYWRKDCRNSPKRHNWLQRHSPILHANIISTTKSAINIYI
jgi:hypothetical protein